MRGAYPTLLLALLAGLQLAACQSSSAPQGFIRVSNGRFVDDSCNEFRFHGWNGWSLLNNAVKDPSSITEKFKTAQASGLTVFRFFFADDERGPIPLSAPGTFVEEAAQGLDIIVAEAAKHDIRVTVVLLNTWKRPNGIPLFEQWCGTSGQSTRPRPDLDLRSPGPLSPEERLQTPYDWLVSPKCRGQVKDYFAALVNRRNTVTGVLYKDDPTIFSWNLLNEPRCKYCGPEAIDSWYGEMAAYMKSIDPNHMITTGAEGFFVEGDAMQSYNPGQEGTMWGPRSGQDFRSNHAHEAIDYAVIHLWPDNWREPTSYDISWGQQWIQAHTQVAAELGKPLILEEFGKEAGDGEITALRDPWFEMVQNEVDGSLQADQALRGALFWQWDGPWGEQGARGPGSNLVRPSDTTFTALIAPFAKTMAAESGQVVPGCTPRASSTAPQVQGFAGGDGTGTASGRKLLQG